MRSPAKTEGVHTSSLNLLDSLERALKVGTRAAIEELRRQLAGVEAGAQSRDVTASPSQVDDLTSSDGPRRSGTNPIQPEWWWLEISTGDGGKPSLQKISYSKALTLTEATNIDFILNKARLAAYIRGRARPITAPSLLIILELACANAGGSVSRETIAQSMPWLSRREGDPLNDCIDQYLLRLRDEEKGLGRELYSRIVERARDGKIWFHWRGFSYWLIRCGKSKESAHLSESIGIPSEDQ